MFTTLRNYINSIFDRDPAARSVAEILLCYPGLHAIWMYRISHWFWTRRFYLIGRWISHLARWLTGIEIHPGAQIGAGFFIDHGMGVVIGETSEVGDFVTLYHGVTLGGVSWRKEKRHPTVGNHVVVGVGAKILGPITVGDHSRIGANSVVVKDVPPNSVVVGVPGRVTSQDGKKVQEAGHEDLQHNVLHDVTMEGVQRLNRRLAALEADVAGMREQYAQEDRLLVNGYTGPWGI